MNYLHDLKPEAVWRHFATICSIPHPSKQEQRLASHIVSIGKKYNLQTTVDSIGNVLIRKGATPGKESCPGIILQSHIDMVPQKNELCSHDFSTDPIRPLVDGEWVRADGTTLGADNGIGVAMMLAVLESGSISHGPLECLFTVDEETGMTGVKNLKPELLQYKRLINLDTEDDSELIVGCAGGIDAVATMRLTEEPAPEKSQAQAFEVSIRGLRGGHSGVDIHIGRGNAIKLLTRVLFIASEKFDVRISGMRGGNVRNAIPREATATVIVPSEFSETFIQWIGLMNATLSAEFGPVEPALSLTRHEVTVPATMLSEPAQDNLLRALYSCPNGVYKMSSSFEDVVETSSNIAILSCENGRVTVESLIRSSIESSREDCANALLCALSLGGAHVEFHGKYPGWKPEPSSQLLGCMKEIYKTSFDRDAAVRVVHAGLECGLIGNIYPEMDMVSCGPTIRFPHSPDEQVQIESVNKFWNFLISVLEKC